MLSPMTIILNVFTCTSNQHFTQMETDKYIKTELAQNRIN